MKTVRYSQDALNALRKHHNRAAAIIAKVTRYAETGAGDVRLLTGGHGARRLRVGEFRVLFEETPTEVIVTRVGPRGSIYE